MLNREQLEQRFGRLSDDLAAAVREFETETGMRAVALSIDRTGPFDEGDVKTVRVAARLDVGEHAATIRQPGAAWYVGGALASATT